MSESKVVDTPPWLAPDHVARMLVTPLPLDVDDMAHIDEYHPYYGAPRNLGQSTWCRVMDTARRAFMLEAECKRLRREVARLTANNKGIQDGY